MSVINDYLKNIPALQRAELERVRRIITQTVPDATEVITYGLPGFKYDGKYLVAFGAYKDHFSIFPASHAIEAEKQALTEYKISKGTVQYTQTKLIPESLIIKLVTHRLNDIKTGR